MVSASDCTSVGASVSGSMVDGVSLGRDALLRHRLLPVISASNDIVCLVERPLVDEHLTNPFLAPTRALADTPTPAGMLRRRLG